MRFAKEIGAAFAITSVAAGCLFPSFDPVEGGGPQAAAAKDAETDVKPRDVDASSAPTPAEGSEAGAALPSVIVCGNDQDGSVRLCETKTHDCCFTLGGPNCQENQFANACGMQAGSGDLLECDGAEDCTGGESCCYVANEKKATCRSECPSGGKILCNGPQKLCGEGQGECTGTVAIGAPVSVNYRHCQ